MLDMNTLFGETPSYTNKWSDPKWREGKKNKTIYTYIAVPDTINILSEHVASFIKKQIIDTGRPLHGKICLKDFDGRDVFVFMCNSNNLLNIPQNRQWQCTSSVNPKPGDRIIVLPTREAGRMPGVEFTFSAKE
tara:strand:+ start:1373 stop:1774 length:402 start_codon:yes stop_codon:yes gene_type:complete